LKRTLVQVSVAALGCIVFAERARALPPEPKDWEIQGTLYGWASRLDLSVENTRSPRPRSTRASSISSTTSAGR